MRKGVQGWGEGGGGARLGRWVDEYVELDRQRDRHMGRQAGR